MTAKELRKARALYIGHLFAWLALYSAAFFAIGSDLLKNRMDFGDWVVYGVFLFATLFLIDLVLAPLFKRKARVWHFRMTRPAEDRWPRAGSDGRSE